MFGSGASTRSSSSSACQRRLGERGAAMSLLRTPPMSSSAMVCASTSSSRSRIDRAICSPKRSGVQVRSSTNCRPAAVSSAPASRSAKRYTCAPRERERVDELVVLVAGPVGPRHVVEEQPVDVARRQSVELTAGPVGDDVAQPADLGVDPRRERRAQDAATLGRRTTDTATTSTPSTTAGNGPPSAAAATIATVPLTATHAHSDTADEGGDATVCRTQSIGRTRRCGNEDRQATHRAEHDRDDERACGRAGQHREHRDEVHRRRHDVGREAGADLHPVSAGVDPAAVLAQPALVDLARVVGQ